MSASRDSLSHCWLCVQVAENTNHQSSHREALDGNQLCPLYFWQHSRCYTCPLLMPLACRACNLACRWLMLLLCKDEHISGTMVTKGVSTLSCGLAAIILGGGAGSRLYPLTKQRAKPAVPIGGAYRLIDVPMSNCINSGISKIYILTQFNSTSLNRHLARCALFIANVSL